MAQFAFCHVYIRTNLYGAKNRENEWEALESESELTSLLFAYRTDLVGKKHNTQVSNGRKLFRKRAVYSACENIDRYVNTMIFRSGVDNSVATLKHFYILFSFGNEEASCKWMYLFLRLACCHALW